MVIEVGEDRLKMLTESALELKRLGVEVREVPDGSIRRALDEVGTSVNGAAGEFMAKNATNDIIDLTVSQSGWLSETSVLRQSQRSGQITTVDSDDFVLEGVPENAGRTVLSTPDTTSRSYICKVYQGTYALTLQSIREARVSGDANWAGTTSRVFGKRIGESIAYAAIRGDTSLNDATRENRLLRQRDGWLKQARATANVATTTRGSQISRRLFTSMAVHLLPERFRMTDGLRWMYSDTVSAAFGEVIQSKFDSTGSRLADERMLSRWFDKPMGIEPLIVPQMPTNLGAATLGIGSVGTPDNVSGSTTVVARVNTLLGGASADNAGRKVKITCTATGQSETRTVAWDSTHNTITTTGKLGQASVSTTVGDYTIDIADCTPVLLTHPRNLVTVMCTDGITRYAKWEQEYQRWRVDVFLEMDFLLMNPDAAALQDGAFADPDIFVFGS